MYTCYLGKFENLTTAQKVGFDVSITYNCCVIYQFDKNCWKVGIGLFKTQKEAKKVGLILKNNNLSTKIVKLLY